VDRELRKGQNEVWFRELNVKLERRALAKLAVDELFEIVCECDREECTDRIPIRVSEYEAVRVSATHFITAPGHYDPQVETLASSNENYNVVSKIGEAALVAEDENPRG
jgi:hypothetical protein